MQIQRRTLLAGVGAAALGLAGCLGRTEDTEQTAPAGELTVAVTTSTYDTGLHETLHAAFEATSQVTVRTVPAGTGEALAAGKRGDVDVVMAHARSLEDEFLQSGHGLNRREFAVGDFVVAGPPGDPADIASVDDAQTAFERIANAEATFLSRGDNSGTHVKERDLWAQAGIEPAGQWYREAGQGMGTTLVQASQLSAYLLTVRGTFIDVQTANRLERFVDGPVTDGDPALDNPYGVIAVNPARHEDVAYGLAMYYIGFLTGPRGQELIAEYTIDEMPLFYPSGLAEEPAFDQYVPQDWQPKNETGAKP